MENIRLLIVDDLPQVREGLATVLKLAARTAKAAVELVGEAQNGHEAVERARSLHPDVILMDLEMPGLDGYEATRQIKAEQPDLRVIILSIHADAEAQQRAHAAGADGFITKGESYGTLLNAILTVNTSMNSDSQRKGGEHE